MTSRPPRPCRGRRDCPTLRVGVPGALFRSRAQRTAPPASHPGLRGAAGAHARVPGGADRAVAPLMPTGTLTKSVPRGRANGAAEVKGCVLSHTAPKGGQAGLQFFHPTDWGGGGTTGLGVQYLGSRPCAVSTCCVVLGCSPSSPAGRFPCKPRVQSPPLSPLRQRLSPSWLCFPPPNTTCSYGISI